MLPRVRTVGGVATGVCPVCGQTETLNIEDVLPQWVRRHATSVAAGAPFTGTLASGAPFNAPVPFQVTVKVGQNCNEWMGKTFEAPAKPLLAPLLDGAAHTLTSADQELIGRWVAKTALMNSLAHPPHPDLAVYQAFRRSGNPPPGSRLLLGFYSSPGVLPKTCQGFRYPGPGTAPRGTLEFLPFNVMIGQLVIVFCLPLQGPPVRTVAEARGALIEIWPPTGLPITWPPSIGLDAAGVGTASLWELA
jgi:hypothetical protein